MTSLLNFSIIIVDTRLESKKTERLSHLLKFNSLKDKLNWKLNLKALSVTYLTLLTRIALVVAANIFLSAHTNDICWGSY